MLVKATDAACQWIQKNYPISSYFVFSGMCSEKRPSGFLLTRGKGKRVTAGALLPHEVLKMYLHCTAEAAVPDLAIHRDRPPAGERDRLQRAIRQRADRNFHRHRAGRGQRRQRFLRRDQLRVASRRIVRQPDAARAHGGDRRRRHGAPHAAGSALHHGMQRGVESQEIRRDRGGGRAGRRDLDGRRDHDAASSWPRTSITGGTARNERRAGDRRQPRNRAGDRGGVCRAGYQVAFTYAGNQAAAESLEGVAKAYQADARDFARAEQVVADVESTLGPIDVLVNNAGIKRDGALHNMDPAAWQEVIDTNLTGTFNYTRALMKHLIRRGGSVINITSVAASSGWRARPITARPRPA